MNSTLPVYIQQFGFSSKLNKIEYTIVFIFLVNVIIN